MFRRRRGRHRGGPAHESPVDSTEGDVDDDADEHAERDAHGSGDAGAAAEDRRDGPWDAGESAPGTDRVDLCSLLVPTGPDLRVQVNLADDQIVAATVVQGPNALQLQALAAPKSSGIWAEVRADVVRELQRTGGSAEEVEGPFDTELRARVPTESERGRAVPRPARFVGVDGPRWLLRGVFTGPAAEDPDAARRLEDVFRGVVVVRGDAPMAPQELLDLQLPPQMREAETEGEASQAEADRARPDPPPRGPEGARTR